MAKLTLRPLPGYCLIEPIDDQETTASGLVMPEKAKEKPGKGRVIEVGGPIVHYELPATCGGITNTQGVFDYPLEHTTIKKDEIVIFHRWAGQDVKEGQKEYRLVKFADLMGVYE